MGNRRSRLTRSKLKRLKKLLHSTWPSSARLNKTLRKLRKGAKWPELNSALPTKHILGHNARNIMRTASLPSNCTSDYFRDVSKQHLCCLDDMPMVSLTNRK